LIAKNLNQLDIPQTFLGFRDVIDLTKFLLSDFIFFFFGSLVIAFLFLSFFLNWASGFYSSPFNGPTFSSISAFEGFPFLSALIIK
jgi:hypothetical protein